MTQDNDLNLQDEMIPQNATVILGISGGMDSMTLFHAIRAKRPDIKIIMAHVHHGLQEAADKFMIFLQMVSEEENLTFEYKKLTPPKSGNIENWGRNERYAFFEELKEKHNATFILTAHHQKDDVESVLMHFMRGTRVKGLSGMEMIRADLLRPLLFTPKEDIEAYAKKHDLDYMNDPSNADESRTRSFLRHSIVPALNEAFPGFESRIQKQKNYWSELQKFLEKSALDFLNKELHENTLDREKYAELPWPLRATILELWYKKTCGEAISQNEILERWDNAILDFESGKKTEWGKNHFLEIDKKTAQIK